MKIIINSTSAIILIISGLMALNNSCTLIGFAVGYNIDAKNIKNNKTNDIKPTEIAQVKIGRNVIITDTIGRTIDGQYKGTSQISKEKYLENYNNFRTLHSNDLSIPMIGDTVEVYETEFRTTQESLFVGLEINAIVLNHQDKNKTYNVPFPSDEVLVYYRERPFFANNYQDLPILTSVLITDTTNNLLNIPVNEIEIIKVLKKNNARFKGLMIGMGVDAAIILTTIIAYGIATDWGDIYNW